MANYDVKLIQEDASADFNEVTLNVVRGAIITATADVNRGLRVLAPSMPADENKVLSVDANGDLVLAALAAGHTQGTDLGTTSTVFEIDSDGYQIEVTAESASKLGVKVNGGATYADLQAKDLTIANATINGTLTVNGLTTTINANTLTVDDKNIELGSVVEVTGVTGNILTTDALITGMSSTVGLIPGMTITRTAGTGVLTGTPTIVSVDSATQVTMSANAATSGTLTATFGGASDATADGGGVTLKGATDKSIVWDSTNGNWTLNQDTNIPTGKVYKINNTTVLSATQVLGVTLGTMAAAATTDYVAKSLYDANTVLYATTDNTPAALTVGASTVVGRKASGDIVALTPAELMGVAFVTPPATKTTAGTSPQVAWDDSYFYVCVATNSWKRTPLAFW